MGFRNKKAELSLSMPIRLLVAWLLLLSFLSTAVYPATSGAFSQNKVSATEQKGDTDESKDDRPGGDAEPLGEDSKEEDGLNDVFKFAKDSDCVQPGDFRYFLSLLTAKLRFAERNSHLPDLTTSPFSPPPETV